MEGLQSHAITAAPKEIQPFVTGEIVKIRPGLGWKRREQLRDDHPTLPLGINIQISDIADDGKIVLNIEGEDILLEPDELERAKPTQ